MAVPSSGLLAWYAADQITGVDDGGNVAQWDDASGNGHIMYSQLTDAVYTADAVNGYPSVRFAGASNYITDAVFTLSQPVSAYFIVNNPGGSRWGSYTASIRFGQGATPEIYAGTGLDGNPVTGFGYTGYVVNGTASTVRSNGVTVTGDAGDQEPGTELALGSEGDGPQAYSGDLLEVLFYDGALTTQELEALDGYAFDKYVNAPLAVTTTSVPDAQLQIAYSVTLEASGGQVPYTWSVSAGMVPAGLTLNSSGVLSGTPGRIETWSFTALVTDDDGEQAALPLSGNVLPPGSGTGSAGVMGWDLYSTLQQQAAYKEYYDTTLPMACPRDGQPFLEGPASEPAILFCVFCGFQYPRDWDAESMSGM